MKRFYKSGLGLLGVGVLTIWGASSVAASCLSVVAGYTSDSSLVCNYTGEDANYCYYDCVCKGFCDPIADQLGIELT